MSKQSPSHGLADLSSLLHKRDVELGTSVARFDTPFEYLRSVIHGFSPDRRFLLNQALKKDLQAIYLRDYEIDWERKALQGEGEAAALNDPHEAYFHEHNEAFKSFRALHYPWLTHDFEDADPSHFEPDSQTDAHIDSAVFSSLGEYGFGATSRKRKNTWWRCTSTILSYPLILELEKSPMALSLHGTLRMESLPYFVDIAYPFFFSKSNFSFARSKNVALQLSLFFAEYQKIFPHVLVGLEQSVQEAEDFLTTIKKTTSS